jgi:hypothetical protein
MRLGRAVTVALGFGLASLALCVRAAPAAASDSPATPGYSAAALYNTANADARNGKPGLAVLNYERARLLAPNDPDIRANLRFVRASVGLPAETETWFSRNARIAGPNTLSWLGLLGVLITGTSLLADRFYSNRRLALRAAAIVGISLMGLTICNVVAVWPTLHEAVIVAHAAPARVSPISIGETLFSLPEAQSVTMRAEHDGFVLVQTGDGRTGWVLRADLAPVIPLS